MDDPTKLQRRTFHRIRFPVAEQPQWTVGELSFLVLELSETSCRLALQEQDVVSLDQFWSGFLRFADGDQIWIEGTVIRLDHDAVVVRLVKGVTFKTIMSLQRELLRKYPARREFTS